MTQMEHNPQPSRRFTPDRIQILLKTCNEPYLNRDIQVEGGFIQLSEDSSPMRQVFLAITKAEFIIVKQETHVDLGNGCHGDDEVSDLSFDEIIPLPMLHFFIIDNRAKRFAACTSLGKLYHFEMCLLDFCTDQLWAKWRCVMENFSGSENGDFDAKRIRTSYVVKVDEKYHKQFETLRSKLGVPGSKTLQFIHHPMTFKRVESVGTQTRDVDSNSIKQFNAVSAINKQNNQAFLKAKISTPITSYSSDSCVVDYKEGSIPSENNLLTHKSSEQSNGPIEIGHLLRRRLIYLYTGNEMWRQNLAVGNAPLKRSNSDGFISMVTREEVGKTSPASIDLSSAKKLQKFRDRFGKEREKKNGDPTSDICLVGDVESCSDSGDEDVDKFFDKVQQKKQNNNERNGRFLWSLAKRLVLKKDVAQFKTNITDVVMDAKFRKLTNSHVPLPASLTDLDPLDVSCHLAHVSRRLFLLITPEDIEMITWSKGHKFPKSIVDVLEFHDVIVRMVVTETLHNNEDGKAGQIRALKFFIQVSVNLYLHHHDYQSLTAILNGLTSLPLYHQHSLWATLFVQEPFSFCHFMTLIKILSPDKQYRGYITRVETCTARGDSFIPCMDHILQHCLTRQSDEHIPKPIFQEFRKVAQLLKFFNNKAKSMNSSKTGINVTNTERSNISKTLNTFGKMKNWAFKAKRDQNKAQRKVRFEENAKDELSSTKNEAMKHRAKAVWFKRRSSFDDIEENEAGEDTVIREKDIRDAAVPVIDKYSDFKAHYVLTDAVTEATGTKDADAEQNTDTGINATFRDEGDAADVENVECKVSNDLSAAPKSIWKVPRMTFSLKPKRKHGTTATKVMQPCIESPPTKEIKIVVEASVEEKTVGACNNTKDENGSGKVNEHQKSQVSNPETERRISYFPAAATSTRRKSLFEEAAEKHASQEEINEAFEALKATRRSETDARKSALELISVDDEIDYSTGISHNKGTKKSIVGSILNKFSDKKSDGTNRKVKNLNDNAGCGEKSIYIPSRHIDLRTAKDPSLPHSNEQNSWKAGTKNKDSTNINQNSSKLYSNHKLTKSVSQDRIGFLYCCRHRDSCTLCANRECIYGERVSTQVTQYQSNLLNMETHSRCRVKEYLKLVMEVYDCRSGADVLKLSFQSN